MMIHKITPSVDYNQGFGETTNLNSIKDPKAFKPANKKTLL